jgi:NAD(P)-dependent dehydrogenase (short-subunit alcohol dehydrogenase family)
MTRPVAMVTGASRGIGRATAMAFAKGGFDLVITARAENRKRDGELTDALGQPLAGSLADTETALLHLGAKVLALPMDLLDSTSIDLAAAQALAHFGRVDVLVNNAIYQGIDINASLADLRPDTLLRVWQAYLQAPLQLTLLLLPAMLAAGKGSIINVSSGAGESDPPLPAGQGGWGFAYGAGKAALSRLAGVIAAEYGRQGIFAYTVNPGIVNTEALRASIGEDGELARRYGATPPELPAAVLLWLATSELAPQFQRQTVQAQRLAKAQGLVPFIVLQQASAQSRNCLR